MGEYRRLFLDYDLRKEYEECPVWERMREFLLEEIERLKSFSKNLGRRALIIKSSEKGNYHLIFPDAKLKEEERNFLLNMARCHSGYKYFSLRMNDCTLRVSEKDGEIKPYVKEVIEWES